MKYFGGGGGGEASPLHPPVDETLISESAVAYLSSNVFHMTLLLNSLRQFNEASRMPFPLFYICSYVDQHCAI